jgi:hypothetical protein
MNRAEELRRAVTQANLPAYAVVIFDVLAGRTDWMTGALPADRQPRSIVELAGWAGFAKSLTERGLDVLERYGWLERERPAVLRRGLSTTYQVRMGRVAPARREPMSDAERARRCRAQRKKKEGEMEDRIRTTGNVTQAGRHESGGTEGRHEMSGTDVTPGLVHTTYQSSVTEPQVNGQVARWAVVGGVSGKALQDHSLCEYCGKVPVGPMGQAQTRAEFGRVLCSRCRNAISLFVSFPPTGTGAP